MVHWVTQRVVTSFNFIQVHQRVVGEGRRSDRWDVEVLAFQARTRIGLQRHRVILLPIITSFFSLWTNSHTPFRYYYWQHYGFGKYISNTQITLLQFHYYARKKIASKAHPLLIQGVLPLDSFIFQETEHKQISKVPLNVSRVLISLNTFFIRIVGKEGNL